MARPQLGGLILSFWQSIWHQYTTNNQQKVGFAKHTQSVWERIITFTTPPPPGGKTSHDFEEIVYGSPDKIGRIWSSLLFFLLSLLRKLIMNGNVRIKGYFWGASCCIMKSKKHYSLIIIYFLSNVSIILLVGYRFVYNVWEFSIERVKTFTI